MTQFMIARVEVQHKSPDDSLILQLVSVSNDGHMINHVSGGRVRMCSGDGPGQCHGHYRYTLGLFEKCSRT